MHPGRRHPQYLPHTPRGKFGRQVLRGARFAHDTKIRPGLEHRPGTPRDQEWYDQEHCADGGSHPGPKAAVNVIALPTNNIKPTNHTTIAGLLTYDQSSNEYSRLCIGSREFRTRVRRGHGDGFGDNRSVVEILILVGERMGQKFKRSDSGTAIFLCGVIRLSPVLP